MKIVVKTLIVILVLISAVAVVALFTKDKYTLTRNIVVNKPKQEVFNYIKLNKNQPSYSKWLALDPNTKIEFKGSADGTPGAILAFSSKNEKAGVGEWETKAIKEGERVDFELRFLEPFEFTANGHFATESVSPDQTKITWVYHSGMNWPMNILLLFLDMDELVGNDIQTSLTTLKDKLEN